MPCPRRSTKSAAWSSVALLPRQSGQFHQGHLDLRVTADALDATPAEGRAHVVGRAPGDLRQLALASGAGLGHARLHEIAVAVQLVAPFEVAVAGLLTRAAEGGVEVAVRLLSRCDGLGERGDLGVQRGAGALPGGLPCHGFEQLVDVGVGELAAPPVPVDPALGGGPEVAGPADAFHPVAAVSECGGRVDVAASGPEASGDPDLVETEWPQPAPGRRHRQDG